MSVPHGVDRSGAAGGTGAQGMSGSLNDLTDPGSDRIVFWDDSVGDLQWLEVHGSGLTITDASMALSSHLELVHSLSKADGNFLVADGTTWTVESGATARASLGITAAPTPPSNGTFVIGRGSSNTTIATFPTGGAHIVNGTVTFAVASSALTIALKLLDGTDASASNPIFVQIPQGNPHDGTYAVRTVTGALSLVISNGSTLGHTNAVGGPVHVYLLDNSGTVELAAGSPEIIPYGVVSTTTEGGAGGADSYTTIYSTTGRTSVPIVPIVRWQSAQTSAGVWASVTGEKLLFPWNTFVPAGTILSFGGSNLPAGFLQCDGSAVSRTTYARLFAAISTTWGVGDGSTTFNIPDLRRRVTVGSGGSGTSTLSNAIGATGGAETHTLTTAELASHTHAQNNGTGTAGSIDEMSLVDSNNSSLVGTGITTGSAGSGSAHNNMQPSAVVLRIIKT